MTEVHDTVGASLRQDNYSLLFIKQGNLLFISAADGVSPTPPAVFELLHQHLTYSHTEFLFGAAARDPRTGKKRKVAITEKRLYSCDEKHRLYTSYGFLRRCYSALKGAGYSIAYVDWDQRIEVKQPHPRPDRYKLNWENVTRHFEYRPRQKECLEAISKSQHGVVHAVTAFGKRIMIVMTCLLYPKAKIHIVTKRVPLVNAAVSELTRYIPNIGQVGGGRRYFGDRITVFTRDSLQHSDFDADILLIDEVHEAVTDEASAIFARYQRSRNFGLTATPTGRSDGTDPRIEGLCGPVIFHIPYWEAVSLGLVSPIRVEWSDVILSHNPAAGFDDSIQRQRAGIWFNDERNDIIASDILDVAPGEQLMALTDTLYHAVELYKRVRGHREREPVLVYDKIDMERFKDYQERGDIPADLPRMTAELKEQYRKRFEAGEIDAIATKTWEVGIDPIYLQYLFVAGSFRSEIKAQQAPGRASRVNKVGKEVGIVRDYRDQFDSGFCSAARERFRIYESLRWEQVLDTGSSFTNL